MSGSASLRDENDHFAAVVDWLTRSVLAWRVSVSLDAEFCLEVLEGALAEYGEPANFLIVVRSIRRIV